MSTQDPQDKPVARRVKKEEGAVAVLLSQDEANALFDLIGWGVAGSPDETRRGLLWDIYKALEDAGAQPGPKDFNGVVDFGGDIEKFRRLFGDDFEAAFEETLQIQSERHDGSLEEVQDQNDRLREVFHKYTKQDAEAPLAIPDDGNLGSKFN